MTWFNLTNHSCASKTHMTHFHKDKLYFYHLVLIVVQPACIRAAVVRGIQRITFESVTQNLLTHFPLWRLISLSAIWMHFLGVCIFSSRESKHISIPSNQNIKDLSNFVVIHYCPFFTQIWVFIAYLAFKSINKNEFLTEKHFLLALFIISNKNKTSFSSF